MTRFPVFLLLVLIVALAAGCNLASARPTPTPTPAALPSRVALATQTSALPTPAAASQEVSPLLLPTLTPLPTPEPTPQPTAVSVLQLYTGDGTPIAGTPVAAAPLVVCTPQEDVVECYDDLLDMVFTYPAFMGQLEYTMLRNIYEGYSYDYTFADWESYGGGRSSDFSAPRGPAFTDQSGFDGRSAEEICAGWAAIHCRQLGPSAVLVGMFPQAEWLCSDAMMFYSIPRLTLALDMPGHPLIKGFAFSFSLLSAEGEAEFREKWFYEGRGCEPEIVAELGAAIDQLIQDLEAGNAESEMQARYDAMLALAASLQSPYFAGEP